MSQQKAGIPGRWIALGVVVVALIAGGFMIQQARHFQTNAGLQLNYSIIVPQSAVEIAGENDLKEGQEAAISITAVQPGFLYVFDRSGEAYPGAGRSGQVLSGQMVRIPAEGWMHFDKNTRVTFIWSAKVPPAPQSELNQMRPAQAIRDEDGRRTILSTGQPVLMHTVRLSQP